MARKRQNDVPPHLRLPEGLTEEKVQEMLRAHFERFPKPPDWELPLEAWCEALLAFDVPKRKIAAFAPGPSESVVLEFTHLVLASPYGMMTDWKAVVLDDEQLIPILARLDVSMSLEERGNDYRISFSVGGLKTSFVRPWSWKDQAFHGQVFDLERILPQGISVYALVEYDKTDTYGHAFLREENWGRVQYLLGDWFGCTFWKHPANRLFQPDVPVRAKVPKKIPAKRRGKQG